MSKTEKDVTKQIDHLDEDPVLPSQQWVCMSFLSPEGIKNCKIRGLKIRGVYATREEADKRAADIREFDADFHVFVGEVGKWLPWDPDPDSVEDQVYKEKALNDLMKGYRENMMKAKHIHSQRKKDLINQTMEDERTKRKNAIKERLQRKLAEKEQLKRMESQLEKVYEDPDALSEEGLQDTKVTKKNKRNRKRKRKGRKNKPSNVSLAEHQLAEKKEDLDEKSNALKKEEDRLKEKKSAVAEGEKNVSSIEDKLAQIKDLYAKMKNKKGTSSSARV